MQLASLQNEMQALKKQLKQSQIKAAQSSRKIAVDQHKTKLMASNSRSQEAHPVVQVELQ